MLHVTAVAVQMRLIAYHKCWVLLQLLLCAGNAAYAALAPK